MDSSLQIEFHSHTIYSGDSLISPEAIVGRCQKVGIDKIVITDHNTINGALETKKIAPDMIIIGEEVLTQEGELLAAYVKEPVPKGLPAAEAITVLKSQGAFISVSHPFDRMRSGGWAEHDLLDILPHIDAIEVFNSRCFPRYYNTQALEFAQKHNIGGTVGSDAHALFEIGRASMTLPYFEDATSLRNALPSAKMNLSHTGPWVRLFSRYAVLRKRFMPK